MPFRLLISTLLSTVAICGVVSGKVAVKANILAGEQSNFQALTIKPGISHPPLEWNRFEYLSVARDEETGRQELRPVVQTFETNPGEVFHLGFDTDGDGLEDEQISSTGEHPFFVLNSQNSRGGEFRAVKELAVGNFISDIQRTAVQVVSIRHERAPPGAGTFATYNFEVEDFHTYFVGESGVWVHNTGRVCEEALATLRRLFEKHDDIAVSYRQLARIQDRKNVPHNLRNETLWGLIDDELPKLRQDGKLSDRFVYLGSDKGVFDRPKEALAAVRYERRSGRTMRRPTEADLDPAKQEQLGSFDFIDDAGKKLDVVGPTKLGDTPDLKIQELIDSIDHHFTRIDKGNPLIDLGGLSPSQRRRIMEKVGRMDWKGKSPEWLLDD